MTKTDIAKRIVTGIVGTGVSKIVADVIKNNTTPKNMVDQVTMVSGAVVLGSMAADASKKYTDAKIDEMIAWYNENFKKD